MAARKQTRAANGKPVAIARNKAGSLLYYKNLCHELTAENARLRQERGEILQALCPLSHDETAVDKEKMLAEVGKKMPLRKFLQQLRA